MIKTILAIILASIFLALSLIHFYWVLGGRKYFSAAIPDKWKSEKMTEGLVFKLMTIVVAIGLLIFGYIALSQSRLIKQINFGDINFTHWGTLAISIIFIVRAIGDFNIVGLFKKHKTGEFAKMDTKVYIPLCLFIGITSLSIFFL